MLYPLVQCEEEHQERDLHQESADQQLPKQAIDEKPGIYILC